MSNRNDSNESNQRGRRAEMSSSAVQDLELFHAENLDLLRSAADAIVRIIKSTLDEAKEELAVHDISGRVKTLDSAIRKYSEKYKKRHEADDARSPAHILITDWIGVRIVCLYEDDVGRIAEKIKLNFEVVGETDRISNVNITSDRFGYKALHYDVQLGAHRGELGEYKKIAGFPVELQIRTIFQDAWSVIDHQLKYKRATPASLARRINVFAALCELADQEFIRIRDEVRAIPSDIQNRSGSQALGGGVLDLKQLLEFGRTVFPTQIILPDQADILLSVLIRLDPKLGIQKLESAFEVWGERLQEACRSYQLRRGKALSPLTRIRILLRLFDNDAFHSVITSRDMIELSDGIRRLSIAPGVETAAISD